MWTTIGTISLHHSLAISVDPHREVQTTAFACLERLPDGVLSDCSGHDQSGLQPIGIA
jgi:hypothetical protein